MWIWSIVIPTYLFLPLTDILQVGILNVNGSNAYCWFGRVLCSVNTSGTGTPPANNGGIIQIITDYRNPATSVVNNNFINVKEKWDGNGNNALWIDINNFNFAGTMRIKIYG